MRKNKLIRNTFLLVIGGFITKILGFIIKILYTRLLKEEGVALITLIFPTYSLLLTISSFALPLAVTKYIAENKERKSKILFNSFWITNFINIFIILVFTIFSKEYSIIFLHDSRCSTLIKILIITLPFVSTTSLIKAYFFGKENVIPVILSNIFEEIIKLIIIIIFLPSIVSISIFKGVIFYLFINLICEISSFIILFIFLPKKINIKKLDYKYNHDFSNKLIKISLPTISGRIIGNIGFFIEPIILTNLLLYKGLSKNYIILNYGYFQGYIIPLLTIPSFILLALSSNIIPLISKNKRNYSIKKLIVKILITTSIGGIIYLIILKIFGYKIMWILYRSTKGYKYLKTLLPFFILFYLESPLFSILQSLDQEKQVFKITTIGIITKYIILTIFILLNIKFMSLIYSEIINIILVVSLCIYYLKKYFSNFFQ